MNGIFNTMNSNASVKSKGVVIFANNTSTVDYVAIAKQAQRLVEHVWQLPVTIISDGVSQPRNTRYSIDSNKFEQWNNRGRSTAYDVSPYDQTIVIDCDYLVFDTNLLKIINTVDDYAIARHNIFVDNEWAPTTMGPYSLPSLWATVLVFNRTERAKMLFDLVKRIETNYPYYRQLYNLKESNYRNDYAFTIADLILNGYTQDPKNYLPWPIHTVGSPIESLTLSGPRLLLKTKQSAQVLPRQDLHIISKSFLLSKQLDDLISEVVNG